MLNGCTLCNKPRGTLYVDPLNTDVKELVSPAEKQHCNSKIPSLFKSNFSALYMNVELLKTYKKNNESNTVNCCYTEFKRENPGYYQEDNLVSYSNPCLKITDFNTTIFPKGEFYKVHCYNNFRKTIYEDYFAFVPTKKIQQMLQPSDSVGRPNVLIIGIDGVSRLYLHRQFPKTLNYLQTLKPIELLGYNKLGSNTFSNLIPALAGMSEQEFYRNCLPFPRNHFDKSNCSYIWHNFKKANYITVLGEDCSRNGIFNHDKIGFWKQPADYYFSTFNREMETMIGTDYKLNCVQCAQGRLVYNITLNYIESFTRRMKIDSSKYFGFFWGNSLSHDNLDQTSLGDEDYYRLFKELEDAGNLDDTIVIFMSGHGPRRGPHHESYQGQLEDRLPFLIMLIPPWFKKTYPDAIANLQRNVHRLTTSFDIYETLKALADVDNLESSSPKTSVSSRGISLFEEIPARRTCKDAGIKEIWCTCQQRRHVKNKDSVVAVANLAVDKINVILNGFSECATVEMDKILKARIFAGNRFIAQHSDIEDYELLVRMKPGKALYDIKIRVGRDKFDKNTTTLVSSNNFEVLGPVNILRVNPNPTVIFCMDTANYAKIYCYCKNSKKKDVK